MTGHLSTLDKERAVRAAWKREAGQPIPFFVEFGDMLKATEEFYNDPERELILEERYLYQADEVPDFGIGSLKPNMGIGIVAMLLGCPYRLDPKTDPWIGPVLDENSRERIARLRVPNMREAELVAMALKKIDCFASKSSRPIRFVNIPSPLVTASLLWEYGSFVASMLLYPEDVHRVLEIVTEATLAFVKAIRPSIPRFFGYTHESVLIPEDFGIRLSDDVAAVLTADLYREFGVRYNNRISDQFGGIVIHSCGNIGNALPAMLETRGLLGLDIVAPQNDLSRIEELTSGKTALSLRFFDWDFPFGTTPDLAEYAEMLARRFGPTGLILWSHVQEAADAVLLAERISTILDT